MRAPPPLSALPSANLSNTSFSGSSILSPSSSQLGGSANENGTRNNTWLANSNGLDSLLNHKHLAMCNNDASPFDDDLPSLLAKQVYYSNNPPVIRPIYATTSRLQNTLI